jgi:hypothetical protein
MKSLLVVAAVLVSAAQIIWATPSVALEGRHDASQPSRISACSRSWTPGASA